MFALYTGHEKAITNTVDMMKLRIGCLNMGVINLK